MSTNSFKVRKSLQLVPESGTSQLSEQGDIGYDSTDDKVKTHDGSSIHKVVTEDQSATLTNKSIDADNNTITNIDNADIKSGAAIDRTKLASGTNNHVLINNGSGVMSSEAQLDKTRGGTGISSTATFPASGTVVTEAGSATLTNKTINGNDNTVTNVSLTTGVTGTLPIANGGTNATSLPAGAAYSSGTALTTEAQLAITRGGTGQSTANAGFNALAPSTTKGDIIVHTGSVNARQAIGSDNQVLVADSSVTNGLKWTTLQQGAKNYITYNNFENNATTGWNKGTVTWSSGLPSGAPTVGSAASVTTFQTTSTNPLAGTYSLQIAGTVAQGQGVISDVLTIDREDRAKVMQGTFYYEVVSGASNANFSGTSSNTLSIYVYDVTNSTWEQPAGVYNLVQSSGQGFCTFTFQTASNGSQYRLFIVAANTASGSITVNFDDFYYGPQKVVYGAPVTDWQSYTPTFTGFGTVSTQSFRYRRVGGSLEVQGRFTLGTSTATEARISLPSGLSVDSQISTLEVCGFGGQSTANDKNYLVLCEPSVGYITLGKAASTAVSLVKLNGNATNASGEVIALQWTVPITGWSSSLQMSDSADTRRVSARLYGATATVTSSYSNVSWSTVDSDSHGVFPAGTTYTVPVSGVYDISGQLYLSASARSAGAVSNIRLKKSGSTTNTPVVQHVHQGTSTQSTTLSFNFLGISCVAGDTLIIEVADNCTSPVITAANSANFISVEMRQGPSTIAASESVNVRAVISSAQTLTSPTEATADLTSITFDTHGIGSTSTDRVTVGISGTYRISIRNAFAAVGSGVAYIGYRVDGGSTVELMRLALTASSSITLNAQDLVRLNAGQYIEVRLFQNSGGPMTNGGGALTVERIGN
jgi:hypothetical protein